MIITIAINYYLSQRYYSDYYCNGNDGLTTAFRGRNLVSCLRGGRIETFTPLPTHKNVIIKPLSPTIVICNLYNVSKVHMHAPMNINNYIL